MKPLLDYEREFSAYLGSPQIGSEEDQWKHFLARHHVERVVSKTPIEPRKNWYGGNNPTYRVHYLSHR